MIIIIISFLGDVTIRNTTKIRQKIKKMEKKTVQKSFKRILRGCKKHVYPSTKLHLVFYAMCLAIIIIYVICMRVYHPLLSPTTFTSREILLKNENLCSGGDQVTVMYIYSSPGAFKNRETIRKTFGNTTLFKKYNLRVFFVLGRDHVCAVGKNVEHIYKEFNRHKDLVVGDFWDTYRNLSLKGIVALEFIHRHCKNARFVIKADDDVIVNTPKLLDILHKDSMTSNFTVWGYLIENTKPLYCLTKLFNKWCVLYSQYNRTFYPPYMFGAGFVLTADLVTPMLKASYKIAPYPIDDVYITGLLLEEVKISKMVNWKSHITMKTMKTTEHLSDPGAPVLYFGHSLSPKQIEYWWVKILEKPRSE